MKEFKGLLDISLNTSALKRKNACENINREGWGEVGKHFSLRKLGCFLYSQIGEEYACMFVQIQLCKGLAYESFSLYIL